MNKWFTAPPLCLGFGRLACPFSHYRRAWRWRVAGRAPKFAARCAASLPLVSTAPQHELLNKLNHKPLALAA